MVPEKEVEKGQVLQTAASPGQNHRHHGQSHQVRRLHRLVAGSRRTGSRSDADLNAVGSAELKEEEAEPEVLKVVDRPLRAWLLIALFDG